MGEATDLIHRWFDEVWNQGRVETIDELLAPDGIVHGLIAGDLTGPEAFRGFYGAFTAAFRDIEVRIVRSIEDGDHVSAFCEASATHVASGKKAAFNGSVFCRIHDGQLQEGWNVWDFLGLLTQLGAVDKAASQTLFQP